MMKGWEHLSYKERLRQLGQFIVEKRMLRGDLINLCIIYFYIMHLKGGHKEDRPRLLFPKIKLLIPPSNFLFK